MPVKDDVTTPKSTAEDAGIPNFEEMYNNLKVRFDNLNEDYQRLAKAFNKLLNDYSDLHLRVLFSEEKNRN